MKRGQSQTRLISDYEIVTENESRPEGGPTNI